MDHATENHTAKRPPGSFTCSLCNVTLGVPQLAEKHTELHQHRLAFSKMFHTDNHTPPQFIYQRRQSIIESALSTLANASPVAIPDRPPGFERVCAWTFRDPTYEITINIEIVAPTRFVNHDHPRPPFKYDTVPYYVGETTGKISGGPYGKPTTALVRTAIEFHGQPPSELLLSRLKVKHADRTRTQNLEVAKKKMAKQPTVELRLRLQTVSNFKPHEFQIQVLEENLDQSFHLQETPIDLDLAKVGIDLCIWEMQLRVRSHENVSGGSVSFPMYLDITEPNILAVAKDVGGMSAPVDSVGFLPSTCEVAPGKESSGPEAEIRLEQRKFKDYGSPLATEVARQYLVNNRTMDEVHMNPAEDNRQQFFQAKPRDEYIASPIHWRYREDQPGNSIISQPPHQVLALRRYTPQSSHAMVIRDLSVSIYAKDMIEHIELRNAHIDRVNKEVAGAEGTDQLMPDQNLELDFGLGNEHDKSVAITITTDANNRVNISSNFHPRLGLFTDTAQTIIDTGRGAFQHFVADVRGMRKDGDKFIFYALVDKSVPIEVIRTVTVLPDHKVLASALRNMQLVDWDEQTVLGPINLNKVAQRIESQGADGMVVDTENHAEQDIQSGNSIIKSRIRDGLTQMNHALWSAAPLPTGYYHDVDSSVASCLVGLESNDRQSAFVRLVAGTDNKILLLYGPPGTGKSTTIACATLALNQYTGKIAAAGGQILMVGPTNTAADAIALALIDRLGKMGVDVKEQTVVKRVDAASVDQSKIPEELEDCWISFGSTEETSEILDGEPVFRSKLISALKDTPIIVTTIDSAVLRLEALHENCKFQLVAIDEAGRVPICIAYPLMSLAPRVLLSGDPRQMRPFFPQQLHFLSQLHLDVSILHLAIDIGNPYVQLVKNFRSVRQIIQPSNEYIYFKTQWRRLVMMPVSNATNI